MSNKKVSKFEKGMIFIGLLGVILLLPGLFLTLGYDLSFMQNWGVLEHQELITLCGLGLIGLTALFGGGDNISTVILGIITGFFLISTALEIGFMDWYKKLIVDVDFLSSDLLNYVTGITVVFIGLMFSFVKKTKFWQEFIVLGILPVAWLYACFSMGWFQSNLELNISMDKGYEELASVIDKKYKKMPQVNQYIQELFASDELTEEEKKAKLMALKEKIKTMEDDTKILSELQKENLTFKDLLESQDKKLSGQTWCQSALNDNDTISSYKTAVRPDKTCVRDFALSLVAHSGSYYAEKPCPSETGIFQIADIHTYISSRWKYVNDPILLMTDYMSPADHTIAINFRGDCDDFSILMASAVESIGGIVRIMGGTCGRGGHAWCEVFIGDEAQKQNTLLALETYYGAKGERMLFSQDEHGDYWLPLDWQVGKYTCNDNPDELEMLYISLQEAFEKLQNRSK